MKPSLSKFPVLALIVFLFVVSTDLKGQVRDTIRITADKIDPSVLIEGTHRYLVYFKMTSASSRTQSQFWTRTIQRVKSNGVNTIVITQEWEDNDSIVHTTKSVSDAKTMQSISHESWWKKRGSTIVNFQTKSISMNGQPLTEADTAKRKATVFKAFKTAEGKYSLNWHLDLETFPVLPYKPGRTFVVPFYDPGTGSPLMDVAYNVTGSEFLPGYDNQKIECWTLTHESKGNKEKFWISKKTKEVLKLEQEVNGKLYRYKVKLPISV